MTVLVLEAGVRLVRISAFHARPYPLSTHSDQGVIAAEAPFLGPTLTPSKPTNIRNKYYEVISIFLDTPFDWNYTVTAQTGLNGRSFPYPRGRLLGGSSSASACSISKRVACKSILISFDLDYLIHQYGTDEDWNRLASTVGDSGWAWSNMQQYVKKVCCMFMFPDGL